MYTLYIKELFDYFHGLFLASPENKRITVDYLFTDYQPTNSQQDSLLQELEAKGVIKLLREIELSPTERITAGLYSSLEAVTCAGYRVEIDKAEFELFVANSELIQADSDDGFEYFAPHMSDDGKTLYIGKNDVDISKSTKNIDLMRMIFASEFHSIKESDYAEIGGTAATQNPGKFAKNVVDHLNGKVEKVTGVKNFLRRENGVILINENYVA